LWFLFCRRRCGVFKPFFDRWQTRRKRLQNKYHNKTVSITPPFLLGNSPMPEPNASVKSQLLILHAFTRTPLSVCCTKTQYISYDGNEETLDCVYFHKRSRWNACPALYTYPGRCFAASVTAISERVAYMMQYYPGSKTGGIPEIFGEPIFWVCFSAALWIVILTETVASRRRFRRSDRLLALYGRLGL
jgi:hypothetical protein